MRLDQLLGAAGGRPGLEALENAQPRGGSDTEVEAVTHDSTAARRGSLFCCVPGTRTDGHDHAPAAVAAGAVALLCERPLDLGVAELRVPSVRRAMGPLAAAFHGDPSRDLEVVGVTGTNGKTTTVHLLRSILEAAGRPCELIGTLTGARTTPEAPELQDLLSAAVHRGTRAVAMEVSSHALAQHRVDGTRFAIAAFTNLSQDHLDFHGTMAAYFAAKASLFEPALTERAVVDLDDAHGRLLRDAASVPTVGYALADASEVSTSVDATAFTWRGRSMRVGLAGRFNLSNALCAAAVAAELGVDLASIAAGLEGAGPVAGRFERVDGDRPFVVIVDYAHTPDGLAQLLAAARELIEAPAGRVVVAFGCGGDRDASKRPLMGATAAAGADVMIVTTDNPRSEDPHAIIDAVLSGVADTVQPLVEPDRSAAITTAVGLARPGDVVVIAGKGHETTQIIGDEVCEFDDRQVARHALAGLAR